MQCAATVGSYRELGRAALVAASTLHRKGWWSLKRTFPVCTARSRRTARRTPTTRSSAPLWRSTTRCGPAAACSLSAATELCVASHQSPLLRVLPDLVKLLRGDMIPRLLCCPFMRPGHQASKLIAAVRRWCTTCWRRSRGRRWSCRRPPPALTSPASPALVRVLTGFKTVHWSKQILPCLLHAAAALTFLQRQLVSALHTFAHALLRPCHVVDTA